MVQLLVEPEPTFCSASALVVKLFNYINCILPMLCQYNTKLVERDNASYYKPYKYIDDERNIFVCLGKCIKRIDSHSLSVVITGNIYHLRQSRVL